MLDLFITWIGSGSIAKEGGNSPQFFSCAVCRKAPAANQRYDVHLSKSCSFSLGQWIAPSAFWAVIGRVNNRGFWYMLTCIGLGCMDDAGCWTRNIQIFDCHRSLYQSYKGAHHDGLSHDKINHFMRGEIPSPNGRRFVMMWNPMLMAILYLMIRHWTNAIVKIEVAQIQYSGASHGKVMS